MYNLWDFENKLYVEGEMYKMRFRLEHFKKKKLKLYIMHTP